MNNKRSFWHNVVRVFGGEYFDSETHTLYCYPGRIKTWFECQWYDLKKWFMLRWYDLQIWWLRRRATVVWIPVEQAQPNPRQRVYVVCENPKHSGGVIRFQTIAEYIPHMTVKEDGFMHDDFIGEGDYNEQQDEYFAPEGFYEWQSESDMQC